MSKETPALIEARRRRAALEQALRGLADAAAAPLMAPPWPDRVRHAVDTMRAALHDHVAAVESPEGLLAEVMAEAPRMVAGVEMMRSDHYSLGGQLDELERLIAQLTDDADATARSAIRKLATEFALALEAHRQRGADLVFDAYAVEIGGGS